MEQQVYTVTELNTLVKTVLDSVPALAQNFHPLRHMVLNPADKPVGQKQRVLPQRAGGDVVGFLGGPGERICAGRNL